MVIAAADRYGIPYTGSRFYGEYVFIPYGGEHVLDVRASRERASPCTEDKRSPSCDSLGFTDKYAHGMRVHRDVERGSKVCVGVSSEADPEAVHGTISPVSEGDKQMMTMRCDRSCLGLRWKNID